MATTRRAPLAADMRGERLQGEQRIFCNEQRDGQRSIGQSGNARARNDSGYRSARKGGGDEIVTVKALAAHGKEQVAWRRRCASQWSSRRP